MLLSKWWSFILGYVVITVEGNYIEKFINMASKRGVLLWDVAFQDAKKVILKVRIYNFKALRHVARKQGCKMRIKHKRGLPFIITKLKKRKMLVVGAVAFSVILYVLSSLVLFIEVKGTDKIESEQILAIAESEGLMTGAFKWEFDPNEVEKRIGSIPQVAWVGVTTKGTKVTIEIAEKVLPDLEANEQMPAHLVAKKDGLVEEVLVLIGVPAVQAGDTVQKGQILISGLVYQNVEEEATISQDNRSENGLTNVEPREVRAKGIVRARTWYEEAIEVKLYEEGFNKTGDFVQATIFKVQNKEIIINGPKESPYDEYDEKDKVKTIEWRNMEFPVELITKTYYELEGYSRSYTIEEALEQAKRKAVGKMQLKMPEDVNVSRTYVEDLTEETANPKSVKIRVLVEAIEEISEPQAIP